MDDKHKRWLLKEIKKLKGYKGDDIVEAIDLLSPEEKDSLVWKSILHFPLAITELCALGCIKGTKVVIKNRMQELTIERRP